MRDVVRVLVPHARRVRLRRLGNEDNYRVGDTVCEILLKNANNGTSAYDLMAGLFRICCLNSLVTQTGTIDSVKVRHSGDVNAKVIEGTYCVLGEAQKTLAAPADWSTMKLAVEERQVFAEAAHVLRFGDADGEVTTPIKPDQLLAPHRYADTGHDLWTTFNVVQLCRAQHNCAYVELTVMWIPAREWEQARHFPPEYST